MEACLRPLVSWRLITTIIKERKNDIGEIEKFKKYSQNNVRIVYNSLCECVCVCVEFTCVLLCLVV